MCLYQKSGGGGGGGGGALYGDLLQLAGQGGLALPLEIEDHLVQIERR